ncbi:hypothetical protein [Xenophilus sp. Marseille-Q4582]|uniref:hypothetical protein n=1 Tax=Xenophilus sp. Marseille-Q4582 TaxID=2866600 RepID=UPI001CE496B5|nr:hypothetical protein [Xenophilus sp. Marseille-Q4582]
MKTPASLWLKTFAVGFAFISALLVWTLFTPAPYGDLTRIGRLSETQFGWTQPAPAMDEKLLHSAPLDQADVLVVGDSFSMTLYWQADLVRAGYKVATTYWGEIGYLCGDFGSWLRSQGYKGKLVIVESIERAFDERLQRSEACPAIAQGRKLTIKPDPFLGPLTQKPAGTLNWSAKLTTGPITWSNTRRTLREPGDTQHGDETLVRVVPDGCQQFSHAFCNKVPFFKEDIDKGPLTVQTFERMQRLTQGQPDLQLLWMVIPNKTTVYLDPQHSEGFVQGLRAHPELGPNLFDFAQRARREVRDFYFPNDTHMSMHGQLAMGAVMLQEVRKRLPTTSASGT